MAKEQKKPKGFSVPPTAASAAETGGQKKVSTQRTLDKLDAALGSGGNEGESGGEVEILSGSKQESLPVAGKSVGAIRLQLKTDYNIHNEAQTFVNGEVVTEDYVLKAGETLEFIRPTGVKG